MIRVVSRIWVYKGKMIRGYTSTTVGEDDSEINLFLEELEKDGTLRLQEKITYSKNDLPADVKQLPFFKLFNGKTGELEEVIQTSDKWVFMVEFLGYKF